MICRTLYQTVENRGNLDEVEKYAPFECTRDDAWLGNGFYFWDTFIDLAHSWGQTSYSGNYYICETTAEFDEEDELDLYGNTDNILKIRELTLKLQDAYKNKNITFRFVVNLIRKRTGFNYKVIRIASQDTFLQLKRFNLLINKGRKPYINLCPAIQCCVIDKSILKLPVKIVYTNGYNAECI